MPKKVATPKGATGARYLFKKAAEPKQEGKWYPADDVKLPVKRSFKPGTAKLRKTLKPGSIVILLAGRFKGKRAVFLKQLPSGLLLVTGEHARWLGLPPCAAGGRHTRARRPSLRSQGRPRAS